MRTREHSRRDHHGTGHHSARETRRKPPLQRTEYAKARAFGLSVEWIRLNEEANPDAIESSVANAKNEPVKNVADERAEQIARMLCRPIQRDVPQKRK